MIIMSAQQRYKTRLDGVADVDWSDSEIYGQTFMNVNKKVVFRLVYSDWEVETPNDFVDRVKYYYNILIYVRWIMCEEHLR